MRSGRHLARGTGGAGERASRGRLAATALARPHHREEAPEQDERHASAEAHHVHRDERVLLPLRVVVVAEEQQLLGRRDRAALGGLEQAEAHVAGGGLDAVEVAREVALGREQVDRRGVRVLLLARVVVVLEADRLGDLADVRLVAREKVPALGATARARVLADHLRALLRRALRGVLRVDADGDDVELLAHGPLQLVQRLHRRVEHEAAEHRARVVREDEDRRPLAVEEVAQLHGGAVGVAELGIAREGAAEVLDDVDALELRGGRVGDALGRVAPGLRARVAARHDQARGQRGSGDGAERQGGGRHGATQWPGAGAGLGAGARPGAGGAGGAADVDADADAGGATGAGVSLGAIIGIGTSCGILDQPCSGPTSFEALGMMSGLAPVRPLVTSDFIAWSMGIGPDDRRCFSSARMLMSAVGFTMATLRCVSSALISSKYATSPVRTPPKIRMAMIPIETMRPTRGSAFSVAIVQSFSQAFSKVSARFRRGSPTGMSA